MARLILSETNLYEKIKSKVGGGHQDVIDEVVHAISHNDVVVIGMGQNPFCRSAKKNLDSSGVEYQYLEYGSYFSQWKPRLALKMWSGWATLPMIFVKGSLIGGNHELARLLSTGELSNI